DYGVTVYAASSMRPTLDRIGEAYTASTKVPVRIVYGASSTMARQIQAGAPADVFVSADSEWVTWLAARAHLRLATIRSVAWNSLVLVAPVDAPFAWSPGEALATTFEGRIALGDPAHVPAGRYAKAALTSLAQWDPIKARILPAANVRAALRFVETGAVPAAVVYATDAVSNPRVIVVAPIPPSSHPSVHYDAAATRRPGDGELGTAFVTWLAGDVARRHLDAAGFQTSQRSTAQ
ncbi:MAG: molybdate transport system substrate-binding protein, partial [Myxococcota bacterium]